MSDNETSGIGRWSQRKTAHRSQKPRSRGPRITLVDDPLKNDEMELLAPELRQEPPASNLSSVVSGDAIQDPEDEATHDQEDEATQDQEDESPEALENLAREHELDPLENLTAESDFRPYMQSGIPDMLKQAAMRRLWRIDPAFGFLDGMNDYDEDFRVIDKLITAMDTSYKVGRGYLDDTEEEPEETGETAEAEIADDLSDKKFESPDREDVATVADMADGKSDEVELDELGDGGDLES